MTLSLEDQLQHFDRKAEQAYVKCLRSFKERKEDILAEARSRLINGFTTFGDTGWHRTYQELRREELEEAADMINYRLMRLRNGWPT